ncbi:hypothetical protein [Alteribacter natronophilus]|uniref:hypothetical protein n=1 Tax=Alteribacter natronophilus TaxID=2583810 RepID=UPI00110F0AF6|nr:hypothetical protein [Alteribacter natronophilus]TMW72982.1 hypothetical protein FGB90_01345 [Alteribacter natronophilus]
MLKKYLLYFAVGTGIGFLFQIIGWALYHMPEGALNHAGIYALAVLPMALMLYFLYRNGTKAGKKGT